MKKKRARKPRAVSSWGFLKQNGALAKSAFDMKSDAKFNKEPREKVVKVLISIHPLQ